MHTMQHMACRICGRILNHDSFGRFTHPAGAPGDHEPAPVRAEMIRAHTVCDFCGADYPDWIVPATDFRAVGSYGSEGDWAACDTCADHVRAGHWAKLVDYSYQQQRQRDPAKVNAVGRQPFVDLVALVRKNKTGPVHPA